MDTTLKIEKQDLNATPITEEHQLFFGHVFRGKSAYQYAIESGLFSGTEKEFAEYLGNIGTLSENAESATERANNAANYATEQGSRASANADYAIQEAQNASDAALEAVSIATNKGEEAVDIATAKGEEAVSIATEQKQKVEAAVQEAGRATIAANAARDSAITAAGNANTATLNSQIATNAANEAAQRANEEVQNLREKADTDGYYPDMTVGKSNNLVGRGDVQDATINFRPSGGVPEVGNGMNITDGAARIEKIKGNSVVYNQKIKNSQFKNGLTNWGTFTTSASISLDDGHLYAELNADGSLGIQQTGSPTVIAGHKYLHMCDMESYVNAEFAVYSGDVTVKKQYNAGKQLAWVIVQPTGTKRMVFYPILTGRKGDYVNVYSFRTIDLTQMFGVGNEPTSYKEYLQRKPINIDDEFADNEGELVDMKVDSLVSVGDNAYNPIERKAKVIGDQKYHITDSANTEDLVVTFYAFDEDENEERNIEPIIEDGKKYYIFPANGYCLVNRNVGEICVCLEHSYEKPIKPYEVNVKDLSFIKEISTEQGELLFPNGMRSAGSAYDEIRYNVTTKKWEAVKRIGDRVYQDEDENNTNLTTDGATTNYKLATPIVVEIPNSENWNLDYLVWDFGTEEAISVGSMGEILSSAPFRADINYEPNAVDDLRWSIRYIRALEQRVLALEQKAVQEANNEEV